MNAFGKRNGLGGGAAAAFRRRQADEGRRGRSRGVRSGRGGDQFPPVDDLTASLDGRTPEPDGRRWAAMDRLNAARTPAATPPAASRKASRPRFTGSRNRFFRACSSASTPKPPQRSARTSWPRNSARSSAKCSTELKITLNRREQFALEKVLVDELLGLGPLEELLADPAVSDIMVNGPDQTFIERKGKLELAKIQFRDEEHLFQIAQRIVNKVGRRVDQTTPLADARLQDGSRVNVIIPPLSLRGTAISIRKFSEKPITLDMMRGFGSMSEKMATVLKIAGASRMNVVISGGTGSGKTTMLNALSKMIDPGERVITIEDAAELRLAAAALAAARNPSRRTSRARARSPSATSSSTLCVCAPTASSWAKFAARSASTSWRR